MTVIHSLRLRFSNAYLVIGSRPILVDTGSHGDMERIEAGLAAAGIDVGDLSLILHTHVHSDHFGNTAAVARRAGCPVSYHPADQPLIDRGDNGPLRGIGLRGRLLARLFRNRTFTPATADVAAVEGMRLDAFGVAGTVFHTPGHTTGSIAVILDSGDAIVGDTLMGGYAGGAVFPTRPNFHYFADDLTMAMASLDRVLAATRGTLFVGHGGPLRHQDVRRWRAKHGAAAPSPPPPPRDPAKRLSAGRRGTADSGVVKGLFVGGLIGAFVVGVMAGLGKPLMDSGLSQTGLIQRLREAKGILTAWDLLALPLLILVVLATHEIGHLVGGLSQGMRFLMLIVGPFGWHAGSSGTRFRWNTNPALMGGLAATVATEVGPALRRQLLVMIAAGPIASLLLAIVAIALAPASDPRVAAYCVFIAATSCGIFLVTLIPVRTGGFMSDGMQIMDVLRGGRAVVERGALMRILAATLDGVRPRDWDASAIEELSRSDSADPLQRTGGSLYLLLRAMDARNDADVARYRRLLEDGVDGYPSGFRQAIHVEIAIGAWLAGDTDAVRRHLSAGEGGIVEESRRMLARAALARLEGHDDDCQRHRQRATEALARSTDAGLAKLTRDQLAMLDR